MYFDNPKVYGDMYIHFQWSCFLQWGLPPSWRNIFLPYKIGGIGEYHLQKVCHFDPGKITLTGGKKDVFVSNKVENGPKRARNGTKKTPFFLVIKSAGNNSLIVSTS